MIRIKIKSGKRMDANLRMRLINLFGTQKGTVPYMRDFGISMDAVDMPLDAAVNFLAAEMAAACEIWEPSVRVASVAPDFADCAAGRLALTVEVVENG